MQLDELSSEYLGNLLTRIESSYEVKENGCWEWNRGRFPYGYGQISIMGYGRGAHRVYYQLIKGFVSDELVISHECDNPPCINPAHLKATTQWENNARGSGPSAQNLRKTKCVNGHEFTSENTIIGKRRRSCRACAVAYSHRRDLERTLEYRAKGLNSKGRPLSAIWKRKYGVL